MSAKPRQEVSLEQASEGVSAVAKGVSKVLHVTSSIYQKGIQLGKTVAESPVMDSPIGRLSTKTYDGKAYATAAHIVKDVDDQTVAAIMSSKNVDNEGKPKSLIKRLRDVTNYVTQKTSADSIVAGGLIAGKHTAAVKVGTMIGLGVAAATAMPALGVGVGVAAGYSIYAGAKIFLQTGAGHWLEHQMAKGLNVGHDFFKKVVRADKGLDPEYTAVGKMIKAMKDESTHQAIYKHDHEKGHMVAVDHDDHGHGHDDHGHHHNKSIKSSLKEIANDAGSVLKWVGNVLSIKNAPKALATVYEAVDETVNRMVVSAMEPTPNALQKIAMRENAISMGLIKDRSPEPYKHKHTMQQSIV